MSDSEDSCIIEIETEYGRLIKYPDNVENLSYAEIYLKFRIQGWEELYKDSDVLDSLIDVDEFIDELKKEDEFISVHPRKVDIFNALRYCPMDNVKVVIIGQDPYPRATDACGLSFSVPRGVKTPKSLSNIYKEIHRTIEGFEIPNHGDISCWTNRGVLLLNKCLFFIRDHSKRCSKVWDSFINKVLEILQKFRPGVVYVLWGEHAKKVARLLNGTSTIIEGYHPVARGVNTFIGCNHFLEINAALEKNGYGPIDFTVDD